MQLRWTRGAERASALVRTVYEARPAICRDFPGGRRCGYYDFLKFERHHQDDPDFIALT